MFDDYFLAGCNLGWFVVGAFIFVFNIGFEYFVGLVGFGVIDGVVMVYYELQAWCLLVLGWVLAFFYMWFKVFIMLEFLECCFLFIVRWVFFIIFLIVYVLMKVVVGIFVGGIVFGVLVFEISFMGLDSFWIGFILMILFIGFYIVLGGLKAVVYIEVI